MRRAALAAALIAAGVALAWPHRRPRATDAATTFNRDVAPIIYGSCTGCHSDGHVGPFELVSYDDVVGRVDEILEVTAARTMPPWLPAPGFAEYLGDRSLSDAQIATIARWAEQGMAEGDPRDLPPVPELPEGWLQGTPDLVLEIDGPYTIPASGPDLYRNFVLRSPVKDTRWIRAVEFIPGNARIVHHAVVTIDDTGASRYHDGLDPLPGFDGLMSTSEPPEGQWLAWVPGKRKLGVDRYAWRLDPGVDVVVQLHLQTTGKVESTGAKLGLYFAEGPPERTPVLMPMASRRIDIPAGERAYRVTRSWVMPVDVELLGFWPHAHQLATRMEAQATLPDGSKRWILNIPSWDFAWQDEFHFVEPIKLPRGSTVSFDYHYDNSSENIHNPSKPPKRVTFGIDSAYEMAMLQMCVLATHDEDRAELTRWVEARRTLEAIEDYESTLLPDAITQVGRIELGDLYVAVARLDDAERMYRAAVDVDPSFARGFVKLGLLAKSRGRFEEAMGHFLEAKRLGNLSAEMHNNLGVTLAALGRADEALAELDGALAAWPGYADAHYNRANVLAGLGRVDEAMGALGAALALKPSFPEAHNNLGIMLATRGQTGDAIAHFRAALALRPRFEGARQNLVRSLGPRGRLAMSAVPAPEGLRVARVEPGGMAAEAGIAAGDLLRSIDGAPASERLLKRRIEEAQVDEGPIVLELERGGARRSVALRFSAP